MGKKEEYEKIIEKIMKTLEKDTFQKHNYDVPNIEFSEPEAEYKIIIGKKEKIVFLHYINKIKEKANYLKKDKRGKDADLCIIDFSSSIITVIEVKNSSKSSTSKEVLEQIDSSLKWIEHIFNCVGSECSEYFNSFKEIKVIWRVQNKGKGEFKKEEDYLIVTGKENKLERIYERNYAGKKKL